MPQYGVNLMTLERELGCWVSEVGDSIFQFPLYILLYFKNVPI